MSTPEDWKIPALQERCARCESELLPGAEVTALLHLEEDGPRRQDLCAACGQAAAEGPEAWFWRHRRPEEGERRVVVDYAMLREVFERMLARQEDVYRRLAYLVALVLVRKRHLRLKGFELRGGREVMVVSRRAGEPELVVPAPHLSAEQMVETRGALARLMEADLAEGLPDDLLAGGPDGPAGEALAGSSDGQEAEEGGPAPLGA